MLLIPNKIGISSISKTSDYRNIGEKLNTGESKYESNQTSIFIYPSEKEILHPAVSLAGAVVFRVSDGDHHGAGVGERAVLAPPHVRWELLCVDKLGDSRHATRNRFWV